MSKLYSLVIALVVMVIAQAHSPLARACGDKLTVLGGGLPFDRIHTSQRQGSMILYLSPDSRLAAANGDARLEEALVRNGHQVRIVHTGAELKQALAESRVDFVLSDWNEVPQLQPEVTAGVPVVPVIYGSSAEERVYAQSRSGCVVESAKGHNRQFVREVESLLENQGSLAESCAGAAAVSG
jgi:hypothetical protein